MRAWSLALSTALFSALTYASGPFPLFQGRVERISMSELHSYDPLEGLNSSDHIAPALYELKRIVQVIYEKDYRFAQPPKMPTLTATPGDSKVILTWDDIADTKTRDPFVGNINDFDRSTLDIKNIKVSFFDSVSRESAYQNMLEADGLLNIGNHTSYQLPSKLIECV